MTDSSDSAKIAGDILVAYLSRQSVNPEDLPNLVREVRAAVSGGAVEQWTESGPSPAAPAPTPRPAVPISESVTDDYLICLEDGLKFRSLKRHLRLKYGMTPEDYRAKWGLGPDYPMVAPSLAEQRSQYAKATKFGRGTKPKS